MNEILSLAFIFGFFAALDKDAGEFDFKAMRAWPVWFLRAFELFAGTAILCGVAVSTNTKIYFEPYSVFAAALFLGYGWTKIRKHPFYWAVIFSVFCFSAFLSSEDYFEQLRYAAILTAAYFIFRFLLEGLKFRLALTPLNRHLRGPAALALAAFFLSLALSGIPAAFLT